MVNKEPHPEDLGEIIIETKLERSNKLKNLMKEGVDFGKIQGKTSDFLWVGGAAKLAEEFGLNAILKELIEEPYGEQGIKITTILDIVDEEGKLLVQVLVLGIHQNHLETDQVIVSEVWP